MSNPQILIVDDQPVNIKLLKIKLEREGLDVVSTTSGQGCLDYVKNHTPDIILLDVMMPEMDGIEVCQRLKDNPKTHAIPVVFVTAKTSKESRLEGLRAGAIDYITKPLDLNETLARIQSHIRSQQVYRESIILERKLLEQKKQAASLAMTEGVAHNLNNLSGVLLGYIDMLKMAPEDPEQVKDCVAQMESAIKRVVEIASQLRLVIDKKQVAKNSILTTDLTRNIVDSFNKDRPGTPPVELILKTPEDLEVSTHAATLSDIIKKLLSNAEEACDGKVTRIVLSTELVKDQNKDFLEIKVLDNGCGLDCDVSDKVFDPFVTTKTAVGRGLGLTTARHLVESLEGTLSVEPHPDGGTQATIRHPL